MPATTFFSVGKPYYDKRRKHEPFCFNTNNDGFVQVWQYETRDARDNARITALAMPGAEELR
jgi:hypothetical protein